MAGNCDDYIPAAGGSGGNGRRSSSKSCNRSGQPGHHHWACKARVIVTGTEDTGTGNTGVNNTGMTTNRTQESLKPVYAPLPDCSALMENYKPTIHMRCLNSKKLRQRDLQHAMELQKQNKANAKRLADSKI